MECLVVGGAGFIGSNLVRQLLSKGHNVDVYDIFTTGDQRNLDGLDVRLIDNKMFVSLGTIPSKWFKQYDRIFYLGMPSSTPIYRENPLLVSKTLTECQKMLDKLVSIDWKGKIILASSSSVYNGNRKPYLETMPVFVTDWYTECRYYIERIFEMYHNFYNLDYIALRLFSVYGPHEEYKRNFANMITQFIWKGINKKNPIIYGDGSQTRDFTYVDDTVRAFLLASESDQTNIVCNVGTGVEYSFREIIDVINNLCFSDNPIVPEYVENPLNNYVFETLADVGVAEREIGFKSAISIEEGIKKTYDYYSKLEEVPYV